MSIEKNRQGSGPARVIELTAQGRVAIRRNQTETAFNAIGRIEGATPRSGSIDDIKAFKKFAERLKVDFSTAYSSEGEEVGGVNSLKVEFDSPHLILALTERLKKTLDGETAPRIPNITAIVMEPDARENGWMRTFLVGRDYVRPISDQEPEL